jgi:predicted dehydrogenase
LIHDGGMNSQHPLLRVALVGFGNAGRIFHAPLISGVPGLALSHVVSSKPDAVLADWPLVKVLAQPELAFANPEVDIVVIATGNESHFPLAHAALLAGKHVVVDKPCAVTLEQTQTLLALAKAQGRVLTVFQNRRWDADFLGLQEVIQSGELGRIVYFESHFDRYRPEVPSRWREQDLPGSGLWFDLGAHLADQALVLFGMPQDVVLDTACHRDGALVNDYFHAQMRYPQDSAEAHPGLRVVLHGSALVASVGPRFVVHGTLGSYVKYGLDTQEDALKAGARPHWDALADWGADPQEGTIVTYHDARPHSRPGPPVAGNYLAFYSQLLMHLHGQADLAVTPSHVFQAMQLLTLGQQSALSGAPVRIA